jgi:REP element-mobilizing transposase RayT
MLLMELTIKPKIEYDWKGFFITIVTKDRQNYFGKILENKMHYSSAGMIAGIVWNDIANCRKDIRRGDYIIMPNHLHGILLLNNYHDNNESNFKKHDTIISQLMCSYKSVVKKYCNKYDIEFSWQSGFHNQYIKSDKDFENKINYIKNNISNWSK